MHGQQLTSISLFRQIEINDGIEGFESPFLGLRYGGAIGCTIEDPTLQQQPNIPHPVSEPMDALVDGTGKEIKE